MQVNNINSRYIYYYYLTLDNGKMMKPLYTGLRKTININTFQSTKIPVPPRDEQDQIVRFLDWKVSSINKLINIKRREIKEIEELKRSLISRAVTHGLNSDMPMKNSGESWIGEILANWGVAQIRRKYFITLGKMLSPKPSSSEDTFEEYVCAKDVHFDGVNLTKLKKMWFSPAEKKLYQICEGDLLIVEGGAGAGNAAIIEKLAGRHIYVQNSIHLVRPQTDDTTNKFLCYWIENLVGKNYMKNICSVATIPHFTKDKVLSTVMPIPPLNEQIEIVGFLDNKCQKLNEIITSKTASIEKLAELKNRLIADVVTGKIDVRGTEIPEYEFVEENLDEGSNENAETVEGEMDEE